MEMSANHIVTPDQKLRVFVSSTLQELAEERLAVKNAIQNIHLIPVMFETGARPYAPRELYREYLAQSQIFIGIYWDRYGWIAPEETISGLEDEYQLAGNLPKLIYIKKSNGTREDRLSQLLKRIQEDDKVSYKNFSTTEELGNLIINDLAVLLTERFNMTLQNKLGRSRSNYSIPSAPNEIIGREVCLKHISEMILDTSIRLVSLTGPGGIGKSRLAIETARRLENHFNDGAIFIPLAPVKDHELVAETICYHLGIKLSGANVLESLKLFLQEKELLLVLDNFEQIIEAASIIDDLLFAAPGLKIIVTSRERLSLSFENVVVVPALRDEFDGNDFSQQIIPPAIQLFLKRAKAIQPSFDMNEQNKETIYKICKRLEGLPLAIELAAGQVNMFSPKMLLEKLEHRLDILKGNFRDIPVRQKTMRNAIDWSFELLTKEEQELLLRISVFNAGCLMHTVEAMGEGISGDVLSVLDALINKSLISKQDFDMQVRFQMMESVREFALEKLGEQNRLDEIKLLQADYYQTSLHTLKLQKNEIDQSAILILMEKEHVNIRQVLDYLLSKKELLKITEISWNLWLFWWVNAHTKEGYTWMKKVWDIYKNESITFEEKTFCMLATNVGIMAFLQRDFALYNESLEINLQKIRVQDDDELVATAMLISGVVSTIIKQYEKAETSLLISLEKYKKAGLTTGISIALSGLGRNSIYVGGKLQEAKNYYKESIELAKKDNNEISVIICLSGFALAEVMEKNSDAKNYLRESILLSQSLHFFEALAWSVEIWALVSINESKFIHAVTLLGAVDHLRNTTHLPIWDDLQAIIVEAKSTLQKNMIPQEFENAWNEGMKMNMDMMVMFAMKE